MSALLGALVSESCARVQALSARCTAALVDGESSVHLVGVRTWSDQSTALRLVVLADRLCDRQLPILASGVPLGDMFDGDMLAGGYRKKYRRASSRLIALNRLGVGVG